MAHHRHDESDEMSDVKKRAKKTRKNIETGGRFKPPEGMTTIRILETPADKERDSPAVFLEYNVHRDIGPNKRYARCGNKPGETGNCWYCKKAIKKEKEGRTKEAAKMAPQLMLAVQIGVEDKDMGEMVGPLLWEMASGKSAKAMGYKIMGVISSDRRNYTDHRKGYNIDIRRKGTGIGTEWGDIDHDEPSKVPKGILKRLKPFVDAGIPVYDEEYIKDAYYGRDKSNKERDDMANKKKKDEDESDESSDASTVDESSDESTTDDSDDESDTKSKKKKGKKSKKDDSDESSDDSDESSKDDSSDAAADDSDTDDSDDESDDKPKKKKKSKKDDSDESSDDSDESEDDSDESKKDDSDESSDESEDESDEKPKKKKKPGPKPGKKKKPGPKPKKKKKK